MVNEELKVQLTANNFTSGGRLPTFKPGAKYYTQFGKEILNGNVAWDEIVQAILDTGYDKVQLAVEVGLKEAAINHILVGQYEAIYFRAGARILTIHCRLFPHLYGF